MAYSYLSMNIQIETYTVYEKNRFCGLFETFGALCADTQAGWRRSEAGLQVRHPFILILIFFITITITIIREGLKNENLKWHLYFEK